MKLDVSIIRTLFGSELRMLLRDRRTIVISVILPLVVMPLMLLGTGWTTHKRERQLRQMTYQYAIVGPQAETVRGILVIGQSMEIEPHQRSNSFSFQEQTPADPMAALKAGRIHLVLEGLTSDEARAVSPDSADRTQPAQRGDDRNETVGGESDGQTQGADMVASNAPVIRLSYRADRDDSSSAMSRMHSLLREIRREHRVELLESRGFPWSPGAVAAVSDSNLATEGQVAGLTLGRIITAFVMLFMLAGGAVVATDSLVGEKERGTLETLLTTAATRTEIVIAKYLLVLAVAAIITLIQSTNLLVYVGLQWIPVQANFAAAIPPPVGVLLFVLLLPLAALTAAVLLLTSSYAKTYKEAQLYFYPVCLLILTPALAPVLPGLSLQSIVVLVPIANIAVAAKEILIGTFHWPQIALSWLVTMAAALWTTRLSVRSLSAERLITTADTDAIQFAGGARLFQRHVLVWFALLWALLLIVSNYSAEADIRVQVSINLLGLFFGATLLMLRRYRLNPREALALRLPKPWVWLAVLIAAPGGLLAGEGFFKLVNVFIPIPAETVEIFSETLIPDSVPLWQLLFFLALLPGIVEEITFRGLLLHGLHRKLHPAALALVVGILFGFFHVTLFRIAPTAFLGVLLAIVVLQTGSIYPAILWHALNNTLAILAARNGFALENLPPENYAAGALLLGCAFWIVWRNRTPYPGLRRLHQRDAKDPSDGRG